jgi:RNA polymerase sigma-70 factor, ECF subfamily
MNEPISHPRLAHLAHDIDRFRAFVRGRVRDVHQADEVLQDAFARAARAIESVDDDDRLDAWFYRILRNRIADLALTRHDQAGMVTDPAAPTDDEHQVCHCFRDLLDRLPHDNAEALRRVDLAGDTTEVVASDLGITANALNVRRHRGRQQLKTLLTEACGMCATEGCRDCQCS